MPCPFLPIDTSVDGIAVDTCVEEEHSTGAILARPSVTDPDGDRLTWTILDTSGSFEIGKEHLKMM